MKKGLLQKVGYGNIQLVTISRPSAYGEYEPLPNIDMDFVLKGVGCHLEIRLLQLINNHFFSSGVNNSVLTNFCILVVIKLADIII